MIKYQLRIFLIYVLESSCFNLAELINSVNLKLSMYQKLLTVTLLNSVYFTRSALMVSVSDLTPLYLSLLIKKICTN